MVYEAEQTEEYERRGGVECGVVKVVGSKWSRESEERKPSRKWKKVSGGE